MKSKFTSLILAYLIQTLEARLTDKDMSVDEARNLVSYSNSRIMEVQFPLLGDTLMQYHCRVRIKFRISVASLVEPSHTSLLLLL